MGPRRTCPRGGARAIALGITLCLVGTGTSRADSYAERRLRTGARLFRALLAADTDITKKAADSGHLLVLFYYDGDPREAEALAQATFTQADGSAPVTVRNLPVLVQLVDDPALPDHQHNVPAGIFLVQAPSEQDLKSIIRFAVEHHVVLFSPHEGHVERGVLGGLVVEAQVLPYVNLSAARESGITIKEFFLKVAKVTE